VASPGSRKTTDPEHARPEIDVGSRMIKQHGRFTVLRVAIERVIHDQEHVYVVRCGLVSHQRPEDDETRQVPGGRGHPTDSFQAFPDGDPLRVSNAESVQRFPQRRSMHAQG